MEWPSQKPEPHGVTGWGEINSDCGGDKFTHLEGWSKYFQRAYDEFYGLLFICMPKTANFF